MPSWASDDPDGVLGRRRPLRARERPAVRQRGFRAAARPGRRGSDRARARIRARAHGRRAAPVHARHSRRPRCGRPRAQPPRAPDVLRASERRHRAIARRVVPARQFRTSRTRRGAEEPHVPRTALDGAGARALGGRSRTRRSSGADGPSASIIGATSARASTGSRASTTDPAAAHMVGRGDDHDRLDHASSAVDDEHAIRGIESQIARLEAARERCCATAFPMTNGNASRAITRTRILRAGLMADLGRGSHVKRPGCVSGPAGGR